MSATPELLVENLDWMGWNLTLATIPLLLATALFTGARPRRRSGPLWWIGVAAFVAFLPNAPYVLTDVIHLPHDLSLAHDDRLRLGVLAEYTVFFVAGFLAYTGSILLVRRHLVATGRGRWVWPVELGLHALSAVGVFLGRVLRFNSWDLVTRPDDVLGVFHQARVPEPTTLAAIGLVFAVLVAGVGIVRVLTATIRDPGRAAG